MTEKKPRAGSDPLEYQDAPVSEKAHEQIIEKVADAKDEGREEADKLMAERQAAGFAPPYDPSDPRPREVKEDDVKRALGVDPKVSNASVPPDADHGPSGAYKAKSSAEVASNLERLRSGPGQPMGEVRDVTVNGVRYRVPTDREVDLPQVVRDVLDQADRPVRTSQMLGGTDGTPTIDLTKE